MEFKGRLKGISKDWMSGKWGILFETQEDITSIVKEAGEKELTVSFREFRKKRSLDANAYYWQLLSKLAEALGISKSRAHNLMLIRYGQLEEYDGRLVYVVVPDTPDGVERALEADAYHIKPTSEVQAGQDGTLFRTYKMLRGSSSYNTKEMSELIHGLVSECRQTGIETMTPDQIADMMRLYEQHRGNKNARAKSRA